MFIGRTDGEVEAPLLWATWYKQLTNRKNSDAAKDQRQEEKGATEDEMVG